MSFRVTQPAEEEAPVDPVARLARFMNEAKPEEQKKKKGASERLLLIVSCVFSCVGMFLLSASLTVNCLPDSDLARVIVSACMVFYQR